MSYAKYIDRPPGGSLVALNCLYRGKTEQQLNKPRYCSYNLSKIISKNIFWFQVMRILVNLDEFDEMVNHIDSRGMSVLFLAIGKSSRRFLSFHINYTD